MVSMAHHGSGDANGAACSHDVAPSSSPAAVAAAAAVPQNGSDGSARCCGRGEAVRGDTTAAAPSALQPTASDGGSANGPTPPPSDFPPPLPLYFSPFVSPSVPPSFPPSLRPPLHLSLHSSVLSSLRPSLSLTIVLSFFLSISLFQSESSRYPAAQLVPGRRRWKHSMTASASHPVAQPGRSRGGSGIVRRLGL